MNIRTLFLGLFCLLPFSGAYAESADEKGLAIAREMDQRNSGWRDSSARLKMTLRNRQGEQSVRTLRVKTLEVEQDGDKSLSVFDDPRDVQGTAFLTFSHIIKPDDQWLYLPALKRVKRIASANKSGPFMGSQFAYEDLASFEVDKYSYKYLGEGTLGSHPAFIIESKPLYSYSGYTRLMIWVDKQRYIPLKIEFYDRKNALLKTLHFKDYKQYLDQYWRAHEQIMQNHQNGKSTLLTLNEYQFRTGLNARDFNRNSLKRIR